MEGVVLFNCDICNKEISSVVLHYLKNHQDIEHIPVENSSILYKKKPNQTSENDLTLESIPRFVQLEIYAYLSASQFLELIFVSKTLFKVVSETKRFQRQFKIFKLQQMRHNLFVGNSIVNRSPETALILATNRMENNPNFIAPRFVNVHIAGSRQNQAEESDEGSRTVTLLEGETEEEKRTLCNPYRIEKNGKIYLPEELPNTVTFEDLNKKYERPEKPKEIHLQFQL